MKHETINDKSRIWVVTRGTDGAIQGQPDPDLVAALHPGLSAEQIADALVIAAGTAEIAETRLW